MTTENDDTYSAEETAELMKQAQHVVDIFNADLPSGIDTAVVLAAAMIIVNRCVVAAQGEDRAITIGNARLALDNIERFLAAKPAPGAAPELVAEPGAGSIDKLH